MSSSLKGFSQPWGHSSGFSVPCSPLPSTWRAPSWQPALLSPAPRISFQHVFMLSCSWQGGISILQLSWCFPLSSNVQYWKTPFFFRWLLKRLTSASLTGGTDTLCPTLNPTDENCISSFYLATRSSENVTAAFIPESHECHSKIILLSFLKY